MSPRDEIPNLRGLDGEGSVQVALERLMSKVFSAKASAA